MINSELLTEKVRAIAVKLELESLTKSSVNDLGEGLIEVFHSVIGELIQISRSARNMSSIINLRHNQEGDHKRMIALNYNLDTHEPCHTNLEMICTSNPFKDMNDIRSHELKKNDSGEPANPTEMPNQQVKRKGAFDHLAGDVKKRGRHRSTEAIQRQQVEDALYNQHAMTRPAIATQTKEIMTMRTKNLYLKEDPAMNAMYDRRISVRDLQFWLRKHPSQISEAMAQKLRLVLDHNSKYMD